MLAHYGIVVNPCRPIRAPGVEPYDLDEERAWRVSVPYTDAGSKVGLVQVDPNLDSYPVSNLDYKKDMTVVLSA